MSDIDSLEFLKPDKGPARSKRFSWGNLALLLGFIALSSVLALQLARQNTGQPTSGPAPDFHLRLFDGGSLRLSDLRGQVTLLNFWASWCPPCRDEAPDLQALHSEFSDKGLRVIGVNILESSREKALDFIRDYGVSYANGEDIGQNIARLYRVEAPPENFLVDREGGVHRFVLGAIDYDDMRTSIVNLLAG